MQKLTLENDLAKLVSELSNLMEKEIAIVEGLSDSLNALSLRGK